MQRLMLLCVGKLKEPYYIEACAEYRKRLSRYCTLDVVELPECRLPDRPSAAEIEQALQKEATQIHNRLPRGGTVTALCVEGQPISSEELAVRLARAEGVSAFVIGGSYGLAVSVKQRADARLSMSAMTFPHHLARVMLLEQIYRAYQINTGSRYHK